LDLDKHPQAATIKQDSLHRDRGLHGTHCREILLKRFLINSFWMVFYNIYLRSGVSSPGCWPGWARRLARCPCPGTSWTVSYAAHQRAPRRDSSQSGCTSEQQKKIG
jgi:hypothetical protein